MILEISAVVGEEISTLCWNNLNVLGVEIPTLQEKKSSQRCCRRNPFYLVEKKLTPDSKDLGTLEEVISALCKRRSQHRKRGDLRAPVCPKFCGRRSQHFGENDSNAFGEDVSALKTGDICAQRKRPQNKGVQG
jgi:hypothetical protein